MSSNTTSSLRETIEAAGPVMPEYPAGNYRLRILAQPVFKVSSKGSDMHVFECEVVDQPRDDKGNLVPVVIDRKTGDKAEFDVTGHKTTIYAMAKPPGVTLLAHMYLAAGLTAEIDNPQFGDDGSVLDTFEGREFFARCSTRKQKSVDGNGNQLKNPIDGKDVPDRISLNVQSVYTGA